MREGAADTEVTRRMKHYVNTIDKFRYLTFPFVLNIIDKLGVLPFLRQLVSDRYSVLLSSSDTHHRTDIRYIIQSFGLF